MNLFIRGPYPRQPHTTRHPSRDPTTPWHQSSRPNIVIQGERVPTEDRELKCECRAMASDVEEHLPVPDRTLRVANDACAKTFVPNEMGISLFPSG